MADFPAKLREYFFPNQCGHIVLDEGDYFNGDCVNLFLSRVLGIIIILGSVGVQIPQILKIWNAKSGKGLSIVSFTLQLLAATSSISYGFAHSHPFGAYGDAVFVMVQLVIIIALTLHYSGKTAQSMMFIAGYGALLAVLLSPAVPLKLHASLQAANIPIIVIGRLIQIVANYRRQSTGQLSSTTAFLIVIGCIVRVFTSIHETGDRLLIAVFAIAGLMNGIVLAQILYYGNADERKSNKGATKKTN
uniref:Mannose-P-dolichol utilization defect 1 protein homolog n=1 Tax=Plectus sambesii TaxID=2011161 RepID=A0A914W927_9BILA